MKLRLVCVGRLSESFVREGAAHYEARVGRYLPLTIQELKEEKGGRKASPSFLRDREGERILAAIPASSLVLVLDEGGEQVRSTDLARFFERQMVQGTPELTFVIGGPYGLSEAVKKRGDRILSLSPLTFTHQMARLFLLEQLYRAFTILRNEPYHH